MMKNFTKILLGLAASATCLTANAKMEWRIVSNEDFGGNSQNDPMIRTDAPHDKNADAEGGFYTPLSFKGEIDPSSGIYMVIKSTGLATTPYGDKLTDCCADGCACWENFGDHTYSDDPNKGYYMVFDANDHGTGVENNDLVLYRKSLPISCNGVNFKFTAWMASASKWGGNTVSLSIQEKVGDNKYEDLRTPINDDLSSSSVAPGTWKKMEMEFEVPQNKNIDKVYFVVKATTVNTSGYDLALDDITIEVNQPEIKIDVPTFYYEEPGTLTTTYTQDDFDAFFGSDFSKVTYQWYKYNSSKGEYEKLTDGFGRYSSGKDISYTISSFKKDEHNGMYRVIIATEGNEGNPLCSIQKDCQINQEKDEFNVEICQDSSKVVHGKTLSCTNGLFDQDVDSDDKSAIFHIKCIKYEKLDPLYTPQCLNNDYPTVGDIPLDDIITRYDDNVCPKTIQKQYMRVTDGFVTDDPAHICEDSTYISDDNVKVVYTEVDEKVGTRIEFDSEGCRHEQYVFVHPKEELTKDTTICKGEKINGVPYNTATSSPIKGDVILGKTIWGCSQKTTLMINVVEPKTVEKSTVVCPNDSFMFDGKLYVNEIDTVLKSVTIGSNGCDSTTILHLKVNDGGTVYMDTLICKDQIFLDDTFTVAGPTQRKVIGHTESGCEIITVWNIEVVEISLKLRLFGNQDEVCQGQASTMNVTLKAYDTRNGQELIPDYHWEPEVPSNSLNPTINLEETTTYTIYADLDLPSDVDKNAKGCHAKEVKTITVHPLPVLTIDSVNPDDRSVEYTVTEGTMPYHMYLGADKNGNIKDAKDLGLLESNYGRQEKLPYGTHKLTVSDSTGCTAEGIIEVKATEPEFPMYFTPNNDGTLDYWIIKNIDVYPDSDVRIYDRYGKLVFSSTGKDFEHGWDGTYNGNPLPSTDYWYEVDIDEIDKQYFGHFTLLR